MGMGFPVDGEGCSRIVIGDEGVPYGVSMFRTAALQTSRPGGAALIESGARLHGDYIPRRGEAL